jgi:hypothetical protein
VAGGVNVTPTVQVALLANVWPEQLSAVLAKLLAFVPLIVSVDMTRLPVPVLVMVTVWAALVELAAWVNVRLVGDTEGPEVKLFTRFAALTVPIPVAKSQPVPVIKAGA